MNQLKYISYSLYGSEYFVIFPMITDHDKMAENFEDPSTTILGAGFVSFLKDDDGEVYAHCYGKSVTMDVKSRQDTDSALLNTRMAY